jgi:L-aminopeptidase/D-esterase-like protein
LTTALLKETPMPAQPGPTNALTDIEGVLVGCAADASVRTGVTVILTESPMVAAVDVRGGGPGTRETDLLAAENLVDAVDAIVFAGGSVYGLGAADAVVAALGAQGRGFPVRPGLPPAPIVPGAILFDLANGGDKAWGEAPPYAALGRRALQACARSTPQGTVGAGFGAMAGALKGGQGTASLVLPRLGTVAALAAVNSFGSVVMPGQRAFWAFAHEIKGEFGGVLPTHGVADPSDWGLAKAAPTGREATTLGLIVTDLALTPAQAKRIAVMAQDGLARAIRPIHAPFDGDVVFTLSSGAIPLPGNPNLALATLGSAAADCLARAVCRAVFEATPVAGERCWKDLA